MNLHQNLEKLEKKKMKLLDGNQNIVILRFQCLRNYGISLILKILKNIKYVILK